VFGIHTKYGIEDSFGEVGQYYTRYCLASPPFLDLFLVLAYTLGVETPHLRE